MELATKEDFNVLLQQNTEILQLLQTKEKIENDKWLKTKDIIKLLDWSKSVFYDRKKELAPFGLVKNGQWRMLKSQVAEFMQTTK